MPPAAPPYPEVPALLRAIWERNLPLIRERLDHLDHTATQAASGTLTADDHALALSNAHKLAGSLGTFGFPAGSDLARSIELLLEAPPPIDASHLLHLCTNLRSTLQFDHP